jgi:hypothetical protein
MRARRTRALGSFPARDQRRRSERASPWADSTAFAAAGKQPADVRPIVQRLDALEAMVEALQDAIDRQADT